jgi:hypothetical protein
MTIKQSANVPFQVIDGCAVLVTPRSSSSHYLNEIGTDIWNFVAIDRTADEIVEFIVDNYMVDTATARADVMGFIREMSEKGLLEVKE